MSKDEYRKRSRYHITEKEAQVIGDAFEQCGSEIGSRGVTIEQFEQFCSRPRHPVHRIWKRRCEQITNGAGRAAAAYLMAAVEIIIIHPSGETPAGRAFTTITIENGDGGYEGTGYRSVDVARNPDLLELAERDTERQIRGLAESFAAVAGGDRMYSLLVSIASKVREQFADKSIRQLQKKKESSSQLSPGG